MLANMSRRGNILPFTLIILAFVSIILVTFGTQVSRAGERLNSYDRVSEVQISTRNIIHIAGAYLVSTVNTNATPVYSEWDDFDAFIDYAGNRGGKEGEYWETVFEWFKKEPEGGGEVTAHFWDLSKDSTFTSLLDSSEAVFDTSDKGAVIYKHDSDTYSIISWTGTENTARRYSYGLFLRKYGFSNPALVLGDLEKTLYQYRSGIKDYVHGTKIIGDAIILGDVKINDGDDPRTIFEGTLSASSVITTFEEYDYTKIATPVDEYFPSLEQEHLDSLPTDVAEIRLATDTTVFATTNFPLNENIMVDLYFTPSADSVHKLQMDFMENGDLQFTTFKWKNANTVENDKVYTIKARDHKLFIRVNYPLLIGDGDAKSMDLINGNYSITVIGDVDITKSIVYEPLKGLFNNGADASNADISNQPLGSTEADVELLRNKLLSDETQASLEGVHLELVSIGGDVNFLKETVSSHSIAVMHGDFKAFSTGEEPDKVGGNFDLVLDKEKTSGSEFWTFGSLMGESFTSEDMTDVLKRFLAISNSSGDSDVVAVPKGFSVVGIRSW